MSEIKPNLGRSDKRAKGARARLAAPILTAASLALGRVGPLVDNVQARGSKESAIQPTPVACEYTGPKMPLGFSIKESSPKGEYLKPVTGPQNIAVVLVNFAGEPAPETSPEKIVENIDYLNKVLKTESRGSAYFDVTHSYFSGSWREVGAYQSYLAPDGSFDRDRFEEDVYKRFDGEINFKEMDFVLTVSGSDKISYVRGGLRHTSLDQADKMIRFATVTGSAPIGVDAHELEGHGFGLDHMFVMVGAGLLDFSERSAWTRSGHGASYLDGPLGAYPTLLTSPELRSVFGPEATQNVVIRPGEKKTVSLGFLYGTQTSSPTSIQVILPESRDHGLASYDSAFFEAREPIIGEGDQVKDPVTDRGVIGHLWNTGNYTQNPGALWLPERHPTNQAFHEGDKITYTGSGISLEVLSQISNGFLVTIDNNSSSGSAKTLSYTINLPYAASSDLPLTP